jgi:hypothetical protein
MAVYVDNFRTPAKVGRTGGRWSHLTADSPAELLTFAAGIGLRRSWFQAHCKLLPCPTVGGVCAHFHFDVTDAKRAAAIGAGAVPIDVRDFGVIVRMRRAAYREVISIVDSQAADLRDQAAEILNGEVTA